MCLGVERSRCVGLTISQPSVSRLSRQCGIFNISQPYRPPRPVAGIALLVIVHKWIHDTSKLIVAYSKILMYQNCILSINTL
jgi:hypothetical protein